MQEKMITITEREYDTLREDSRWLQCLEDAGLDSWDGIDFAREIYQDMTGEDDE